MTLAEPSLDEIKAEAASKPPFRIFVRVQRNDWPTNLGEFRAPFLDGRDPWAWRFTIIGGSGHIHASDWRRESATIRRYYRLPAIEVAE
jgi:hypothetical protein